METLPLEAQEFIEASLRAKQKVTQQWILATLLEKFGIEMAASVLSSYKTRRYEEAIRQEKEQARQDREQVLQSFGYADALIEDIRQRPGEDAEKIARQLLARQILIDHKKLADADILKMLAEQRKRMEMEIAVGELEVKRKEAETSAKEAELKLAQFEKQREREKKEVEKAVEEIGSNPDEFRKRIGEIYGVA